MASSNFSGELYQLSLDSVEDNADTPWHSLVQNLSYDQFQSLKNLFQDTKTEKGLGRDEFMNAICTIYGNSKYSLQSLLLFDEIDINRKQKITWKDFIDFLEDNLEPKLRHNVLLSLGSIAKVPHTKRETIAKVVLIETDQYFCYVIICKHGKVGIYDNDINLLCTYHVIMSREDINRKNEERQRKNRWITDAVYCSDVLLLLITNSTRSITIYDVSGLKHVPLWLILGIPSYIQCLDYKFNESENILYMGDCCGQIYSMNFLQANVSFLRKKHNDKISLFYWTDVLEEGNFVIIKYFGFIHKEAVERIEYFGDNDTLVSCSRDPLNSVVKNCIKKQKSYTFKMCRGASHFAMSFSLKILITASGNGVIRIWNDIITAKPTATIKGYHLEIVDLQLLESQLIYLTCSKDGVLKLWDLKEEKCIQVLKIKFPCFEEAGKIVEWGNNCIYPGPKRCNNLNIWERSHILMTCCNYITLIRLTFDRDEIMESFLNPVFPPPPLEKSALIPNSWRNMIDDDDNLFDSQNNFDENLENHVKETFTQLEFLIGKDFLEEFSEKCTINSKFTLMEMKKHGQIHNVVSELGGAYLALDLHKVDEVKLNSDLPIPKRKYAKSLVDDIEEILSTATSRDQIFSETLSLSSRSRSSLSTIDIDI